MMKTRNTLELLQEQEQDFEWYPTTDEMIKAVFHSCGGFSSLLDIGAGDGRVLERMDKLNFERIKKRHGYTEYHSTFDKYAIEKSMVHIENMPPDISIVGTDFMLQALVDKKVDIVFCNPPYSEFETWAVKIVKEANTKEIFLVLPTRWNNSKPLKQAIKLRTAKAKVIWSGDFTNADRKARAKVDIVKICITDAVREYERDKADPFDVWFDEYFSGFAPLDLIEKKEEEKEKYYGPKQPLVRGQNIAERLCELYTAEMNALLDNYKSLSEIDAALLSELGVKVNEIKKALKQKIKGLKYKYWQELFDNLDKITNRLTSQSRIGMLDKLNASCNVDFSVKNAYAIVIWVIKNANKYIDRQLTDIFKKLSEPECVKNYKSNIRTWEKERWRYKDDNHSRYMLEYRIITHQYSAIKTGEYNYGCTNNLHSNCHSFINDIFTIANNLGFINLADSRTRYWESNQEHIFRLSGQQKDLVRIRAFKNGNLHLKFDQTFIKTLNVEASRLLGWIKTPEEAAYEMGLDINFVKSRFKSNLLLGVREGQKLLTG